MPTIKTLLNAERVLNRTTISTQDDGSLPLAGVERAQENDTSQTQESALSEQGVSLSISSSSPMDGVKEGIRRRLGQLMGQADALIQSIQMAMPQQLESLAKELKRLALELKQLVAQYKAIQNFQPSKPQAGASGESEQNFVASVMNNDEAIDVASDQLSNKYQRAAADIESTVAAIESELNLKVEETADSVERSAETQVAESYKDIEASDLASEEGDGIVKGFRELLEKLKLAKDLLKQKAEVYDYENADFNSAILEVAKVIEGIESELIEV